MRDLFFNQLKYNIVGLLLGCCLVGQSQPANDNCANAQFISTIGTYTGSTAEATTDMAGGICNDFRASTKGVWYQIIGNGSMVTLSTCGEQTNYDTWLGVYKGSCAALTCVVENDDLANPCIFAQNIVASKASEVSFIAETDVIYYILIGGTQLKTGNFTLGVFCEGGKQDCIAPLKLRTVTRKIPADKQTNVAELTFLATFNNEVTGVDAADFKVIGTTASIEVTKLTNSTYDLTLKGGDLANLNEFVTIDIVTTADIMDLAGNALTPEAPDLMEAYVVDNTAPLISSFTRNSPTVEQTNADELTFLATFNEPVVEVDAADFSAIGTTGTIEVSMVTDSIYKVTIKGGDLATITGKVGLDFTNLMEEIQANLSILDSAGNVFIPMEPAINEAYQLDNTAPTLTINQANTQGDPTKENTIHFEVVFSEAVTGFATGDVTIGGTAGATTATVTGNGTTYQVAVTGMTTSGTVIPIIAANIALDAVGNNNVASSSTDNEVRYDITAPTVLSLSPLNNSTDIAINTNLTLKFSEPIQKGSETIRIYKKLANELVETIDINSLDVTIEDSTLTVLRQEQLAVDTDYYVQVTNGAIQDIAGNAYAGINNTTNWAFKTAMNSLSITAVENNPLLENSGGTLDFIFEAAVAPDADLTINYILSGTATNGEDYETLLNTATLAQGEQTTTVKVSPRGDAIIEPTETVILTLAESDQYAIGTPSSQTGMIANDDFCPLLGTLADPADICQGESFNLQIAGLEKMAKAANGDQNYGIQWMVFSEATENPYTGGTNLGKTSFGELTGATTNQIAVLSMTGNVLTAGDYTIYAILTPAPTDAICRPFKKIDLTVKSLPLPTLEADVKGQICSGTNVQFTANGGVNYEFLLNNQSVQQGVVAIYNNTSLIQGDALKVVATDALSCKDTSNVYIAQVNSTDTDEDTVPDCRDICPGGNDLGLDEDMDEVPDDCDCDPNNAEDAVVEVTGLFNQITTGVYKAGSLISSSKLVVAENKVTFQAGETVVLQPGFTVQAGGFFHALIVPCKDPTLLTNNDESLARSTIDFFQGIKPSPLELTVTPNPFIDQTMLHFFIPTTQLVNLTIYNQTGNIVKRIWSSTHLEAGKYDAILLREDLWENSLYYVVLQTAETQIVKKLVTIGH